LLTFRPRLKPSSERSV